MAELTAETPLTPDAPASSNSRSWLGSWKLWLLVLLAIALTLFVTVAIPLLRIRAQWQIANAIRSKSLQIGSSPVLPDWYEELRSALYDWKWAALPSLETPSDVLVEYCTISAETFNQLSKLRLERFEASNIQFDGNDMERFAIASPELRVLGLYESEPVPLEVQARLSAHKPQLRIRETGTAFPGIHVWPTPYGLQTREESPAFPELPIYAFLTEMEGQPIESYHQIKDRVAQLQPGEQLRFTVKDQPGTAGREVIYTAPGPGKLLP